MPKKCHFRARRAFLLLFLAGLASGCLLTRPMAARAEEASCEGVTPETIQAEVAVAEASVRSRPAVAYEHLKKAEAMLPCLKNVVPRELLGNLFRTKGMVLLYLGNSRKGEAAFRQAALVQPDVNCRKAMARFGTRSRARQGVGFCEAAVANAKARVLLVKLEGLRGIAKIYVDGQGLEREGDYVPVELSPGRHLLQFKHEDGDFSTKWLVVPTPEDLEKTTMWLNLKKLGLAPYVEEIAETGTLRIEGLPQGAQVLLDGRVRRDLPVLRNVDVGERHLMIRTPDGTVMGSSVLIEADKETVYTVGRIAMGGPRRSGTLSTRNLVAYGSLGVGALSAVGSSLLMVSASNTYADAEDAYQVYMQAEYGADFDTLYDDAETKRQDAHKTQVTGLVLGGVAAVAVGAGTFLMITDAGPFAWLHPYVVPVAERAERSRGVAVGLRAGF